MSDVVAIVEGQTEQAFVRDHLVAHLGGRGIAIWARLPGRVVCRGGVRAWESVRGDVLRTLRERPGRICTTMFDLYAMPNDWPGRASVAGIPLAQKGHHVEQAMIDDLAECAGQDFRKDLFIPYVQVHEFEALLFADVAKTAEALAPVCRMGADRLGLQLNAVLQAAGQAEAINDGYQTCPSRQITALAPAYRKAVYGPIIAGRIGLGVMREACPHFGQWLARLEALGPGGPGV